MNGFERFFCVQIAQISEPDQSFCGFSYINTLAFVSPHIYCILIILDYNVRSVKNKSFIDKRNASLMDRKTITTT